MIEPNGVRILVDYGHNPSAVAALVGALDHFPSGRRIAAFTGAGDRRDEDLIRQGELLGGAFDRVVLYEDQSMRGREPGAVRDLLRRGLASGRRVEAIEEVSGEPEAIVAALRGARAGDLVVIQADETAERSLGLVRRALDGEPEGDEISRGVVAAR